MGDPAATLAALARSAERPLSRRIADLWPHIEAALAAGVSRKQIVGALNAEGLSVSVHQLDTYLYRLRKTRDRPPASKVPLVQPPAPSPSSDPRSLDTILRSRPDMDGLARLARKQ